MDYELKPTLVRQVSDKDEIVSMERRLTERFIQRSLPYWDSGVPNTSWDYLFAMQHYGVPTRLLDWSENLFIALYFSALIPKGYSGKSNDIRSQTLWILDPISWNNAIFDPDWSKTKKENKNAGVGSYPGILSPFSDEYIQFYAPEPTVGNMEVKRKGVAKDRPVAMFGNHNSGRIVSQRGTFTISGYSTEPMDSFLNPAAEGSLLKVNIEIPKDQLMHQLQKFGFSETMIFPDLDALGREIAAAEGMNL